MTSIIVSLFAVLLLPLTSTFAAADDKTCVSQAEMREIANHFTQFEPYAEKEFCLDGSEISNLLDSLLFMRKTSFKAPLEQSQDELFSGRFKDDWYGYFVGRISEIEIDRGCPKGVGAYVYGFFGSKMYVCTMMLTQDFTSLDRASVFMHEARHIDGYPHVTCQEGPRAGIRGACDRRISDGGSYAVSVETYAQIAKYATELHPALRAYSRAAAVTYADEAFDQKVRVDRAEGLVTLSNDKNFYQLKKTGSGQWSATLLGAAPSLGFITPRAEQLILFPNDYSKLAGYVFPRGEGEISQQAGEVPRLYNQMSREEKATVIDAHIAGQWTALIDETYFEFSCDIRSDRKIKVNLSSGGAPLGFVYPEGYSRSNSMAHVSMQDGSLYEVGCLNANETFIRPSSLKYQIPMKSIYKIGTDTLGIDQAGSIYEINQGQQTLIDVPSVSFAFELAPYSHIEFFDAL